MTSVGLVLILAGCASLGSHRGEEDAEAPVPETESLLPVDALEASLSMRQRVTIRWGEREEGFDAVLQKRDGELLLVGLGPMNTLGFRLELGSRGVVFENRSGREMPFRPEHILADVQRVFYPWITDLPACLDCVRRATRIGLDVEERIGMEYLEERRFGNPLRPDLGEIVVRYESWLEDAFVPSRAVLENGWYEYELTIETLQAERLD